MNVSKQQNLPFKNINFTHIYMYIYMLKNENSKKLIQKE